MSEAGRASSLPGMAPPAPNGAIPMGVRSFLRHALSDLPVAVSLAALAAVALPGVGGLVILTLAGVRIGYRQAKAGFVLGTAGIARFAGPGPLGVVRSGSLVVVRPRGLRVVRPGALIPPDIFSIKSPSRGSPGIRLSTRWRTQNRRLSWGALRLHVAGSARPLLIRYDGDFVAEWTIDFRVTRLLGDFIEQISAVTPPDGRHAMPADGRQPMTPVGRYRGPRTGEVRDAPCA